MDSGNMGRDPSVRLQETSNIGNKLFLFAFPPQRLTDAFGNLSVSRCFSVGGWGGQIRPDELKRARLPHHYLDRAFWLSGTFPGLR